MFQRLHDDPDALAADPGLRPDLLVVTGDLAEWGLGSEFEQVVRFLSELTEAVELPRRHVALVPGNHDINRNACEAYSYRKRRTSVSRRNHTSRNGSTTLPRSSSFMTVSMGEIHPGRAVDAVRDAHRWTSYSHST